MNLVRRDPMWYRDSGSIIGNGLRNLFDKMKNDGFPQISTRTWGNYYPNGWNGHQMHEWMEVARNECWNINNRPRSSKAIEAIIRHIVQTTSFINRNSQIRQNHLNAILVLRIGAIECGMMTDESADEYFEMNLPV